MPLVPHRAVAFDVDQVPGGVADQPRVRRQRAEPGQLQLPIDQGGDTAEAGGPAVVGLRVALQPRDQFGQGGDAFADQHGVRARGEEGIRMIGGVGAGDDHPGAAGACRGDHLAGRLAHAAQAHLGQEVEVVLVQHHHVRPGGLQGGFEILDAVGKHRVEQAHRVPHLPQQRGDLDRGERGIRLAALPLLRVEPQEVGVADVNPQHLGIASIVAMGTGRGRALAWAPRAAPSLRRCLDVSARVRAFGCLVRQKYSGRG